jgi:hypothetical protein
MNKLFYNNRLQQKPVPQEVAEPEVEEEEATEEIPEENQETPEETEENPAQPPGSTEPGIPGESDQAEEEPPAEETESNTDQFAEGLFTPEAVGF